MNPKELIDLIESTIGGFRDKIPAFQRGILDSLLKELQKLSLNSVDDIKNSIANLRVINKIRAQLQKIVVSEDYNKALKSYLKAFDKVEAFQNKYFTSLEEKYTAPTVLGEIKKQARNDVIDSLAGAGVGVNIGNKIMEVLKSNVTTGSSYKSLTEQLRKLVVGENDNGILNRYAGQIVTDAVNQYSAQTMQLVSGDLGYEWYRYQGQDIDTTRPFCDAMTDQPWFHISEVPRLLRAEGLTYLNKKTGKMEPVPIYAKTGLPAGMYDGTDASNFFSRRGGYWCGHKIFPYIERIVPKDIVQRVKATAAYKLFKGIV